MCTNSCNTEVLRTNGHRGSRCVYFCDELKAYSNQFPIGELDPSILWYSSIELEAFRNEARDQCKIFLRAATNFKASNHHNCPKIQSNKGRPSLARDSESRGLEQRYCKERQKRMFLYRRYLLKAVNVLNPLQKESNSETLAAVAKHCSEWE